MTNNLKKTGLLLPFFVFFLTSTQAQNIAKGDLLKTWHLEKYREDAKYYGPPTVEQGDYILLKKDMTFVSKTEGKMDKGTWMLNTNGSYIEMKDGDGKIEKMYILYSTSKTLVVVYELDDMSEMEVHYTAGT